MSVICWIIFLGELLTFPFSFCNKWRLRWAKINNPTLQSNDEIMLWKYMRSVQFISSGVTNVPFVYNVLLLGKKPKCTFYFVSVNTFTWHIWSGKQWISFNRLFPFAFKTLAENTTLFVNFQCIFLCVIFYSMFVNNLM